jgi:hypothetical protein
MVNVILMYCNGDEADFERTIPLLFVGERNRSLGYSNDIQVLFTYGYDRLRPSYVARLRDLGFAVHDVSALYQQIEKRFPGLTALSPHHRHTFLRWPLLDEFLAGAPLVHYDGDIVPNEDPARIASLLDGRTFVLQGCPALTAVSDPAWLEAYESHLQEFARDVGGYSERAWRERDGWEITFRTRWAGSRSGPVFRHDQDLLSHLIHTGRIQQAPVEDVMTQLREYAVFENPLFVDTFELSLPLTYLRENGVDYFSYTDMQDNERRRKRVLMWHMQGLFAFYLSKYLLRRRLVGPLASSARIGLDLESASFEDRLNRQAARMFRHTTRLHLYEHFFDKSDFAGVLRNRTWWRPGVFT